MNFARETADKTWHFEGNGKDGLREVRKVEVCKITGNSVSSRFPLPWCEDEVCCGQMYDYGRQRRLVCCQRPVKKENAPTGFSRHNRGYRDCGPFVLSKDRVREPFNRNRRFNQYLIASVLSFSIAINAGAFFLLEVLK